MKRFLTASFIVLTLIISAAGAAPAARADCQVGTPNCDPCPEGDSACVAAAESFTATYGTYNPANDRAVMDAASSAPAPAPGTGGKPVDKDDGYNSIMMKIMSLFAWLVGAAMLMLNYAVYFTVVTMGSYVKNLEAVGATWMILRDIGNIFLIFGFIAVGVTTILNVDWYGGGKKMLPMMLVAAVFLNFSLFITEAFIDVGNLFATQFYTQINGPLTSPTLSVGSIAELARGGISGKIMSQLGLATLYDAARGGTDTSVLKGANPWFIGFLGIILFIILAFVLFSLAFVLIARFVILLFLIIVSPVAFAGLAVPGLKARMMAWWSKLFEQVITAPILLLMLYIALKIITANNFFRGFSGGTGATGTEWTSFATNAAGFAGVLLSFLVAMGLLLAVVIQSKNLSAFGASQAMKLGGMASFGAVSLAGRATLGGVGGLLASKRMQSWARTSGVGGLALKGLVLGGKGLRGATYDIRNMPGATAGLGMIGVDAGKGATLTAKQVIEAQGGWKPTKEWLEHSKEERDQAGHEMDFKDAIQRQEGADILYHNGGMTPAEYKTETEKNEKVITDSLSRMSTKQLEELGGIKKGTDALVQNLSPQQFEALMKSDKLNDVEKGKIKEARYRPLTTAVNAPGGPNIPDIEKAVKTYSKGELESLPAAMLTNQDVQDALSAQQFETLMKSEKVSKVDKGTIMQRRYTKLDAAVTSGSVPDIKRILNSLSNTEIESIPATLLTRNEVLDNLTDKQRDTIIGGKERSAAEKDAVRNTSPSEKVKRTYNDPALGGPAAAVADIRAGALTPAQVAKLPKDILVDPNVVDTFTPATLTAIQEEKKLVGADITTIRNRIMATANPRLVAHITGTVGAAYWG